MPPAEAVSVEVGGLVITEDAKFQDFVVDILIIVVIIAVVIHQICLIVLVKVIME